MNEEYQKSIEEEITLIKRENLKLKNDMEEMIITNERKIDEMISEFIKVIDSFDKSETVVKEKGLDQEETSQKAIKRMLQPKKVAATILDKYDVHKIDILGKPINEDMCTIVETEPDLEQEDGIVISIEKDGYTRGNRLIRRAEVVVIKN